MTSSNDEIALQQHRAWSRRVGGLFNHYYNDRDETNAAKRPAPSATLDTVNVRQQIAAEDDAELVYTNQILAANQRAEDKKKKKGVTAVPLPLRPTSERHDAEERAVRLAALQMGFAASHDVVVAKQNELQDEIAELLHAVIIKRQQESKAGAAAPGAQPAAATQQSEDAAAEVAAWREILLSMSADSD